MTRPIGCDIHGFGGSPCPGCLLKASEGKRLSVERCSSCNGTGIVSVACDQGQHGFEAECGLCGGSGLTEPVELSTYVECCNAEKTVLRERIVAVEAENADAARDYEWSRKELYAQAVAFEKRAEKAEAENARLREALTWMAEWLESTDRVSDREPARKMRAALKDPK